MATYITGDTHGEFSRVTRFVDRLGLNVVMRGLIFG